jgi:hypothetical protein
LTAWCDAKDHRRRELKMTGSIPLIQPEAMKPGQQLMAKGRVNVRLGMPNEDADFAAVTSVLPSAAQVTLIDEPVPWRDTGFIWARVRY